MDREVFVYPPVERRVPGVIWRLKRPCYGLADASRGFHISFTQKLEKFGCTKSFLDPALYTFFEKKSAKDVLHGLAVSHVDDVLHAGDQVFEDKVVKPLKQAFKFGAEEEAKFKYIGMNVQQSSQEIKIDYEHYIETIEIKDVADFEIEEDKEGKEILAAEGQTLFRSTIAKINTLRISMST